MGPAVDSVAENIKTMCGKEHLMLEALSALLSSELPARDSEHLCHPAHWLSPTHPRLHVQGPVTVAAAARVGRVVDIAWAPLPGPAGGGAALLVATEDGGLAVLDVTQAAEAAPRRTRCARWKIPTGLPGCALSGPVRQPQAAATAAAGVARSGGWLPTQRCLAHSDARFEGCGRIIALSNNPSSSRRARFLEEAPQMGRSDTLHLLSCWALHKPKRCQEESGHELGRTVITGPAGVSLAVPPPGLLGYRQLRKKPAAAVPGPS